MIAQRFEPPTAMIGAGHYFQDAGCEPIFNTIDPCNERVEVLTCGRGWVNVDGEWTEVTAGVLLWHVEGDQTIARSCWDDPYRCLSVKFRTKRFRGNRRAPRLTYWMDKEEVERFTQKVVHWHVDDHFDRTALLAYTYGTLLFHARVWERNKERIELPARLQTTLRLLKDRCTQHAPLREIAKEVGCSLPYLHELVRVHLRTTPHALVLKSRMHMARERLATTDQAVKQIAGDCGFATSAAFCHAFKSRVGLTPLDYRRKQAGP